MNLKVRLNFYFRHRAKVGDIEEWTITNAGHTVSHPMHIHVNAFQVDFKLAHIFG